MTILHYIFIGLEVVLLFNLLIGVHELGHFLAAKWRGLKIERFAIWFGKPIWKKKLGGVEYALGWIPAGGYVALPQMATMDIIEGKSDIPAEILPKVSALDKIIVAFAGPLFSFLLAFFFAFVVWGVGKPTNDLDNTTEVGWVDPTGPATAAGLQAGDKIIAIDHHPVTHFSAMGGMESSVTWRIITSENTNIAITFMRDGREQTVLAAPFHRETKWYERKSLRQILISPASKAVIYEVASNSPAARAGLTNGDEIVALNGHKIYSWMPVIAEQNSMSNNPVRPVILSVKRGGEEFDRALTPVKPIEPTNGFPSLGIVSFQEETNMLLVHPNPFEQIQSSVGQIFETFQALFSRKSEIGVQQLGGAVLIIRVYSNLFQSDDGWRRVLWFSVILNVNLALINLLPLPVLDGGHITLSLIEMIRRRPVSARVVNVIQNGFMILLIFFMLYIAFFDAGDWFRSARANRDVPEVFAPANSGSVPADHFDHGQTINVAPDK